MKQQPDRGSTPWTGDPRHAASSASRGRSGGLRVVAAVLTLVAAAACANPMAVEEVIEGAGHTTSSGNHTTSSGNLSSSGR
jgi:hypothetical protein